MPVNKGIQQMIPIRVTFGGAINAFDFRKLLNENQELVVYRVYDRELPPELQAEFDGVIAKIGAFAEQADKFANIEHLRNTVNAFNARESLTAEHEEKIRALIEVNKNVSKQ